MGRHHSSPGEFIEEVGQQLQIVTAGIKLRLQLHNLHHHLAVQVRLAVFLGR